ncbi:hypothetical protein ACWDBO_24665 [Streptomyces mirabilis]|uniref:hypothetical protein n=1 Tax=Streptomyces TaxID=1883 RepID=UPI0029B0944C|nr:hypothetical protein [Streptomyces sp. AK02-04a]MDX3758240.1 hypothetical protein [Streptomyces sp. AK02-04a]
MQHPHRQHRGRAIGSALVTTAALIAAGLTALGTGTAQAATGRQVEALDRGVVSECRRLLGGVPLAAARRSGSCRLVCHLVATATACGESGQ